MALLRLCSGPNALKFTGAALSAAALRSQVIPISASAVLVNRNYHQASSNASRDHVRGLSSQATTTTTGSGTPLRDPLNTSFADPVAAFKSKTLMELMRAYVVYMICSSSYIVENNMQVRHPYQRLRGFY